MTIKQTDYIDNTAFESELATLAEKAQKQITAPPLDIAVILSPKKPFFQKRNYFAKKLFFKPAISFATIILCVLSVLYFSDIQFNNKNNSRKTPILTDAMIDEIEKDLKFAEAVDNLEDYALSGFTISPDSQTYEIDEFIEFVTPTNKTYF